MATLVNLTVVDRLDPSKRETQWVDPEDVRRVQPWLVTADEPPGSWVTLKGGQAGLVVTESPVEVVRRLEEAEGDAGHSEHCTCNTEQEVRVVNWMEQLWVLLVANLLVAMLVGRVGVWVGDRLSDLFWYWPTLP